MINVLDGGLQTTVQDYPGRVGYWNVGIPPSGPMDHLAFCVGNRLVGNPVGSAGLEMVSRGVSLEFTKEAVIALTGAEMDSRLNESPLPWWSAVAVFPGDVLQLGSIPGDGFRSYLCISGGLDLPEYLGSQSTFLFGGFGGLEGRALRAGDRLPVKQNVPARGGLALPPGLIPSYTRRWELGAIPGPHEAPDFFTERGVDQFYSVTWRIHHNSNRQGYRLVGPKLDFARVDGGEGGHHPSNIHDYPYAIGTVNISGNLPIVLNVDGPSLGGFVSLATIPLAERWKLGQMAPNHHLRFRRMSLKEALRRQIGLQSLLQNLGPG